MGIENKTGDVDNLYTRSYTNCITYEKTFKQTKFEEDRAYVEYYKQGLIIGNNINIDYGYYEDDGDKEEEEKFDGGLVADPGLFGLEGMEIFGIPSRHALRNVVDFDFSSMYPWIIITFNISRGTMIGKLLFDQVDVTSMLKYAEDLEGVADKGKIFLEDYLTEHIPMLGAKWFGLPTTDELVLDIANKNGIDIGQSSKVFMIKLDHHEHEGKRFKFNVGGKKVSCQTQ